MAEKPPTVSVIIPTYNRAHLVGRAIRSVLNQTYQDFELIVVDDGSTDNTGEVVRSFNDDRIKCIRHEENKGGGAARNTGIRAAWGEYIAFLDSDDEWLPENLEKKVRALNSTPADIGLVYSKAIKISTDHQYVVPKCGIREGESVLEYLFLHRGETSTITLLARSNLLRRVLFDESLEKHQDWDLTIRLQKVTKFYFIDEPLAIWHSEQASGPRISKDLNVNASLRFMNKHESEFVANKKVLAGFKYKLAIWCLKKKDTRKARRFMKESMSLYPFRLRPMFLYLSTFLGKDFVGLLFRLLEVKIKALSG